MWILSALALLMLTGLLFSPVQALSGAANGLKLCSEIILPSLFPFFVCTKLLTESGFAEKLGRRLSPVMRPVFNIPGCGGVAFILGVLGGYPLGAKCAADMYSKKLCTKAEAERIICFCNNSGPLFIIGSVGVGLLCSKQAGILLYIIHLLSALTLGIIMRFYKRNEKIPYHTLTVSKNEQKNIGKIFSESVKDSVLTTLFVCGFIVFFSVFISLAKQFGIIDILTEILKHTGLSHDAATALCYGIFELTNGAAKAAALPSLPVCIVVISVIAAWSGVSVIFQTSGIIAENRLNTGIFVLAKALQSVIAGMYACILCRIPVSTSVFSDGFNSYTQVYLNGILVSLLTVVVIIGISFATALIGTLLKLNNK